MKHEKLMKTARILDKIAKIAAGFMSAFVIVLIVFAVLVLIFGDRMFVPDTLSLELGHVQLYMTDAFPGDMTAIKVYAIIGLTAGSVLCAFVRLILAKVRSILAPMKEGRPFEANIPEDLRRIAWLSLASGLLVQLVSVAERICFAKAFPLEQIVSPEAVSRIEYFNVIDLNFVWVFFIILFLSYIFRYGQMLQQEADETL